MNKLAKIKLNNFVHSQHKSNNNLQENDFYISEDYYYVISIAMRKCMRHRVHKTADELDSRLMEDLRGHLPHWTPSNGDKIVSSTVKGGSTNVTDVGKYVNI